MKRASRKLVSQLSTTRRQIQDCPLGNPSQNGGFLLPNSKKFSSPNPFCISSIFAEKTQIRNYPVGNLSQESVFLLPRLKKFGFLASPPCCSSFSGAPAQFRNYPAGSLSQSSVFLLPSSKKFGFLTGSRRNLCTNVDPQPQSEPSETIQGKVEDQKQISDAFSAAETVEEMLSVIKDMEEAGFAEFRIGACYSQVACFLYRDGEDMEKVMNYGLKALDILENYDETRFSVVLAINLHLLGSACYDMDWWTESLGYLERANTLLHRLEEEGHPDDDGVLKDLMLDVHTCLIKTKTALERKEDTIDNLTKCLEIQEARFGKDSKEVGDANRELAEAFVGILNFKEALPNCLKALELHESQLGNNLVAVASDRVLLGVIYTGLEEKKKASEQNQLLQEALKDRGLTSGLLSVVIDAADLYIEIGKPYEAVQFLYGVVSLTDKESIDRATIFISIAKALGNQEKLADTKKSCLDIACRILGNKESSSPLEVCKGYDDISTEYQEIEDYESAISLSKKSLALLEKLPQEKKYLGIVTARMGWLLRLAGKMELSISCFEEAVELLKESYGRMHLKVVTAYSNMACAYDNLGKPELAAHYYSMTLDILDASIGPHHWATIKTCEILSEKYDSVGNFDLAIKFRERAVEGWKAHGPSRKWEMQDNQYLLEQLKKKARIIDEASKKAPPVSYNKGDVPDQKPRG